jgi:hypothetical protein
MNRRRLARLAFVASLAPLTACPGGGGNTSDTAGGECAAGLVGGELVITEFLPDPPGADGDGIEWFEVYNASGSAIGLDGIGLIYSKADGSDPSGHLIMDGGLEIGPGEYMTFGKVTPTAAPPHVDFGYGSDLGEMSNSGGRLSLMCGGTLIDEVVYDATKAEEGATAILDGNVPPSAEANDDLTAWCISPTDGTPYFTSEFGSPRAQNAACPLPMPGTCGQCYENEQLRDSVAPQPGQLVITEVMPNASSLTEDSVGEWFELAVTDGTFDLNCLQYGGNTTKFAEDPASAEVVEVPQCMTVTAGDVVLFSQKQWTETDVVMSLTLGDNATDTNPDPGVFIAHGGVLLDEIHYESPKDGVAFSLDPAFTTVAGNDDPANFCLAVTPYAEGDLGTPGAANPVCLKNPCQDGDSFREAVAPTPGQVFLTEVHANVSTDIGEPAGEWVEFLATAAFDLNGVQLGKSAADIDFTFESPTCLPVGPGLVLLARDGEPGKMLEPHATYTGLQLSNTDGTVWIGIGGADLDAMPYESPKDGVARQVDPAIVDAFSMGQVQVDANDPAESRCDATVAYAPFNTDLGTPGAPNSACDGPPPMGQCTDPDTMMERPIVPPTAGQLLITEYMANPKLAPDASAEWFELFADADFDLNGLEIGKVIDPYTVIETIPAAGPCVEVKAGQFALLARSADPAANGMLPPPTVVLTKLSLTNTTGSLFVGLAGQVLDHLSYTTTVDGAATQLKPELVTPGALDVAVNDIELNLCPATAKYNGTDAGTPGAANSMCGGMGGDSCVDAMTMMDRAIVSPAPGDLLITEFLADPTIVADTAGEWFEVLVVNAVDLNLVKVLSKAAPTPDEVTAAKTLGAGPGCIRVEAGARALIARNADPALNGGLPAVDAVTTINLGNASGAISLHVGGVLLDAVTWAQSKAAGKSTQLSPGVTDPAMNDNADAAPWCTAVDAGTPKQENLACP